MGSRPTHCIGCGVKRLFEYSGVSRNMGGSKLLRKSTPTVSGPPLYQGRFFQHPHCIRVKFFKVCCAVYSVFCNNTYYIDLKSVDDSILCSFVPNICTQLSFCCMLMSSIRFPCVVHTIFICFSCNVLRNTANTEIPHPLSLILS